MVASTPKKEQAPVQKVETGGVEKKKKKHSKEQHKDLRRLRLSRILSDTLAEYPHLTAYNDAQLVILTHAKTFVKNMIQATARCTEARDAGTMKLHDVVSAARECGMQESDIRILEATADMLMKKHQTESEAVQQE